MKLIVGLGNPGAKYKNSRHNAGFMVVDSFLADAGEVKYKNKFSAKFKQITVDNEQCIFVKPQTFMNSSGTAVKQFVDSYSLDVKDVIVVHDDVDIEPGKIKVKFSGGAGGHNGIASIITWLESNEFTRIRVGIGKSEADTTDHVLSDFEYEELNLLKEGIDKAKGALKICIKDGHLKAMNEFNLRSVTNEKV